MITCWLDVETTGLDANTHGITEISMVFVDTMSLVDQTEVTWYVQPFNDDQIDPRALEIQGLTEADLITRPEPPVVFSLVQAELQKQVAKLPKGEKLWLGGHNVKFDLDFFEEWFTRLGGKMSNYFNFRTVDTMQIAQLIGWLDNWAEPPKNYKLGTLCEMLNIPLSAAHTSRADIKATIELCNELVDILQTS